MREQTALVISIILLLIAVFAYPVMGFKLREAFMVVKPTAEEYNNLVRENIALKTAVARGLGQIIDDFERHKELLDNPLKPPAITL